MFFVQVLTVPYIFSLQIIKGNIKSKILGNINIPVKKLIILILKTGGGVGEKRKTELIRILIMHRNVRFSRDLAIITFTENYRYLYLTILCNNLPILCSFIYAF